MFIVKGSINKTPTNTHPAQTNTHTLHVHLPTHKNKTKINE